MNAWALLWSVVWFVGLGLFTVLAVLVIYFGARDLKDLMRSLEVVHQREPEEE